MITIISNIFIFIGGLGMFLFGMHLMSESMQKIAGKRFNNLISVLTTNRFMGILIGALVTIIVNSSSATTVMVVGFVNAEMMTLNQAVGVIMGANIGTTVTSWIVSLTQLGDTMETLNPSFYAPLIVGIAAFIELFATKEKTRNKSLIALGFGLLFMGLTYMQQGIEPYSNSPIFSEAFITLGNNPLLGILVGTVVTMILQSSAASISILQTLTMNGTINRGAAYFVTMGQNIGTCITAIISSAGGNKNGKRAALLHLLFNTFGSIIITVLVLIINPFLGNFLQDKITSVDISIFHTSFNIINTIILFNASDWMVKISKKLIPDGKEDDMEISLSEKTQSKLDKRILEQPAVALSAARDELLYFITYVKKNVVRAIDLVTKERNEELIQVVFNHEEEIDKTTRILTSYFVSINSLAITNEQHIQVEHMLSMCSDIERIGDHAENIAKNAISLLKENLSYSDKAIKEVLEAADYTYNCIDNAYKCIETKDMKYVDWVRNYEQKVDDCQRKFREEHIKRLSKGECNVIAGIAFLETLGNLERITDHANNLADYIWLEIK